MLNLQTRILGYSSHLVFLQTELHFREILSFVFKSDFKMLDADHRDGRMQIEHETAASFHPFFLSVFLSFFLFVPLCFDFWHPSSWDILMWHVCFDRVLAHKIWKVIKWLFVGYKFNRKSNHSFKLVND